MQLKKSNINYEQISEMGLDCVQERVYTESHPDVILWTNYFLNRFRKHRIFEGFNICHPETSLDKARVVGVHWHSFSELMPAILCCAATMVSNNRLRHYVIQTAYEELGARDSVEIHHEMFWATTMLAGVSDWDKARLEISDQLEAALNTLRHAINNCDSDEEILGLLLGLEICAQENIESIFTSLAHNETVAAKLDESKFFKLHRELEMEHIRLDVSIFLRFCHESDHKKSLFIQGFDVGVKFWEAFWVAVSSDITSEKSGRFLRA